ncbi:MAG: carbon-nitrogen hydrolase family protein [Acidobacteria bacterium]|nr:carbon-nitrogen hydrolase family protein [Acidobacteriota bacterium]MBV9186700.1 carbon-nitrogen hydrolase family protein [Acidobacteriota bacterium]
MRVTVCELPHEPDALARAWAALCEHTARHSSELVLLPEFAMVDPLWQDEHFDAARWSNAEAIAEVWRHRLAELTVANVVGTRPVTIDGRRFNQGFLWSTYDVNPLRRKFYLPDEPGNWEARWFERGDPDFGEYSAGTCKFGLNICTELWALETYATYAARGVQVILSPRATAAATTTKWLSVGIVAAVRSGAFSLSSNRVDPTGACGGVGWIIDPYGTILARTTADAPFATVDIDLSAAAAARDGYPGYIFSRKPQASGVGVW